jgi:tetrahydrodipicolinate N-succinyltransferase
MIVRLTVASGLFAAPQSIIEALPQEEANPLELGQAVVLGGSPVSGCTINDDHSAVVDKGRMLTIDGCVRFRVSFSGAPLCALNYVKDGMRE